MSRTSICVGPWLLVVLIGCDGATVALDGGSVDPSVADDASVVSDVGDQDVLATDAGSSYCRSYCKALVDCSAEQSQAELTQRYGPSICRDNGVEPPACAAYCEMAEANRLLCARCAEQCDTTCLSESCAVPWSAFPMLGPSTECWVGETEPSEVCGPGPGAAFASMGNDPGDGFMFPFRYEDVATVTATAPVTLSTPEHSLAVRTSLVNTSFAVGDTVHLRLEVDCPFWCSSSAFVIRSTAGDLIWAGWSRRRPLSIPEFDVAFEPDQCLSTNQFGAQTIHFVAHVGGQTLSSGESLDIANFRFHNGVSRLLFAISVSDIDNELFAGAIERIQ